MNTFTSTFQTLLLNPHSNPSDLLLLKIDNLCPHVSFDYKMCAPENSSVVRHPPAPTREMVSSYFCCISPTEL